MLQFNTPVIAINQARALAARSHRRCGYGGFSIQCCFMLKNLSPAWPLALLLLSPVARGADWTTFGGDPQRTGWAKEETDLTKDKIGKLRLEWSLKLDNTSKELNSLTAPLVHSQVI